MNYLLTSIAFVSLFSFGQIGFQETYGGIEFDHGNSVQQTADGGYIAFGYSNSFGNGNQDLYLVKTDEFGVETWSKTYGTSNTEWGNSVKQTSDGGYILCGSWNGTSDSLVLIKTDDLGMVEWNSRFSGTMDDEAGQSVIETSDGGFMAVGFASPFPNEDVFMVKTNSSGIEEWSHVYNGPGKEIPRTVRQTSDSGYFVFGSTNSSGNGMNDYYLMRLNPQGDTLWTKTYGTPEDEIGKSMHLNADGSVIMIGNEYFSGGNIYVVKADQNGNVIWDQYYGGLGWDQGNSVKQTSDGGFVLAGRKDNVSSSGTHDMHCIKIDENGGILWEYSYPYSLMSDATCINQTTDGGFIMTGTTLDSITFTSDLILLKIPGTGVLEIDEVFDISIEISAFPNPFIDHTTIQVNDDQNRQFDLTVYSSKGDLVYREENISNGQARIDRQSFSQGVHFFEISIDDQIVGSGRLIAH